MSVGILSYGGNSGVDDMGGFNARMHAGGLRGENTFRVYPADGKLYFIRIGSGRQQNNAVAIQFGLLGALIGYFLQKRQNRKTRETLNTIAGVHPSTLLPNHKYNFMLDLNDIASAVALPGGFFSGTSIGRMRVVERAGKKRALTFDDTDNMRAAITQLEPVLGDRLTLKVDWDDAKQKYRKKK